MKKGLLILVIIFSTHSVFSQASVILDGIATGWRLTVEGDFLYYTDINSVKRINITDADPTPVTLVDNLDHPVGVAIKNNFLFVSEYDLGIILKYDLDNLAESPLLFTDSGNRPNLLKFYGDYLYYSDNDFNRIYRKNINNASTDSEIIFDNLQSVIGFTINGDFLYYTNTQNDKINKIDLLNTEAPPIELLSEINHPVAIEIYGNEAYIVQIVDNKISKFNLSNPASTLQEVVINLPLPKDIRFVENDLDVMQDDFISKIKVTLDLGDFLVEPLKIYPNPCSNYLRFQNLDIITSYKIYDITGRVLKKGIFYPDKSIEVDSLASGHYIIVFEEVSDFITFIKK